MSVEPTDFVAIPTPIHHASTVIFPSVADMRARRWERDDAYTYGLHGTPTTTELKRQLADIEGAQYCELAPSGLAAIAMIDLAFLQSGDAVAIPDNAYAPNRDLARDLLTKMGVEVVIYDPLVLPEFPSNTRLVWIEAPGSVSLEVPDVPALVQAARRVKAVTAMDNTWSAGIAFQPLAHGVDIVMQALTKYQSGGGDVLMGAALTRERAIHLNIKHAHMRLGLGVGADDAWLVLRGLATLRLRYAQHDQVARYLASWMQTCPQVKHVLHPALAHHPGHDVWRRDFKGAAGLFSVVFDPRFTSQQVDAFVDALRVFRIGYSWGGPVSLVMPYDMTHLRQSSWQPGSVLVRFSVGLESVEVLQADIQQALEQSF